MLGSHGKTENTIILTNGGTFATSDKTRFGAMGSWSQSTQSVGAGGVNEELANANARLDSSGLWWPTDKDGNKQNANWLKDNPLVSKDGVLNTKWSGTWQYKLLEASRNPEINLEDVKEEAIKAMNEKGIYDVSTLAKIRNWSAPKSQSATINFVQDLKNTNSELIVGGEISRKDLEGFDLTEDTIAKLKKMGITVVDNTVGSQNNGIVDAENFILEKLINTEGGYTAGKEAILDDVIAKAVAQVQVDPNRTPQNENALLMEKVELLLANEFAAAQTSRDHPWYINEDGHAVNQLGHPWDFLGWIPSWKDGKERNKQKAEAETRLNTYLLNKVDPNDARPASKQITFWDKGTLTGIVKKYNEKGYIDFSVLNSAAIAGEDPIDAINNQIEKHGLDLPPLVKNEIYEAFTTTFDHGDIQTIYKLNGNKGSKTPSITAARIINEKVDRLLQSNGTGLWNMFPTGVRMPSQQGIEATIKESFNGDLSTNRDGRLGIYGIPIEEAKRIVGPSFELEKFLKNKDLQDKTIRTFISEETVRNYDMAKDVMTVLGKRRSSGFGSAFVVRNILHTLTTGERQDDVLSDGLESTRIDKIGLDQFNKNTELLQIYTNNYNGGFVPSRNDPRYFNRFGF